MSQSAEILRLLQAGKAITALDAVREFRCLRLAARIADLKADGHKITSTIITKNGKHFASYKLAG
jgi:hypothetical protein